MTKRILLILLLLLSLSKTVEAYNWCEDAKIGGCWLYEEGSGEPADSSSNNNDGTISGTVTWATASPPKSYSTAYLNFAGSDDYVNVGTMGSFASDISSDDVVSGTAWIRTSNTTSMQAIYGVVNTGSSTILSFSVNTSAAEGVDAHDVFLQVRDADNSLNAAAAALSSGVSDGTWNHLAFVEVPSTNTITIYVDGVSKTVGYSWTGVPDNIANFNYNFVHGARNVRGTYDRDFTGDIDELSISTRTLDIIDVNDILDNGLVQAVSTTTSIFGKGIWGVME